MRKNLYIIIILIFGSGFLSAQEKSVYSSIYRDTETNGIYYSHQRQSESMYARSFAVEGIEETIYGLKIWYRTNSLRKSTFYLPKEWITRKIDTTAEQYNDPSAMVSYTVNERQIRMFAYWKDNQFYMMDLVLPAKFTNALYIYNSEDIQDMKQKFDTTLANGTFIPEFQ